MTATLKPPIAGAVARLKAFSRDLSEACLDRSGTTEEVLAHPRSLIYFASKSLGGAVLCHGSAGNAILLEAQSELARMLRFIDSLLPIQKIEVRMAQAAPVLAPMLDQIQPLIELIISLDPFVTDISMVA